jgi:hypothetical protein
VPQSHHDDTFADYLALERDSEVKHEFDAGEILAMSGGTARHSALAVNVAVALTLPSQPISREAWRFPRSNLRPTD